MTRYNNQLRNMGIALISIWLAIVIYAYLTGISGTLTIRDYEFRPWSQIRGATVYLWMPWVALIPLVFYLSNKVPVLPNNWHSSIVKHLLFMFILTLCHGYLAALLYYHIGLISPDMVSYEAWQHTGHFLFNDDNMFLMDAFIYTTLVASQNLQSFFILTQNNEVNNIRMKNQLSEAKLLSLKMQINPHFLFNTLNSISVLIKKQEIKTADRMLNRLSEFFRLTLDQGAEQYISLEQELDLIRHYLDIESLRFGERLKISIEIQASALNQKVPVLMLQPLVENSIKHGLSKKTGPCTLTISSKISEQQLSIVVTDNGLGSNPNLEYTEGLGLQNVQARLQTCYNDNHQFKYNSSCQGTEVTITLPLSHTHDKGRLI